MEPELLQLNLTETYRDNQQRHFSADDEGNMTFIFDEDDFGSQIWGWPADIRINITAAMN